MRTGRERGLLAAILLVVTLFAGRTLLYGQAVAAPEQPAAAGSKLFLKDGTYQLVRSYETRGDRVRFYSLERSEWEEIPASLVDFPATKLGQQHEQGEQDKAAEAARALDKERFEAVANTGYQVAPGFNLPDEDGVFAFDGTRIIRMIQSSSETERDKKRMALSMAVPGPLIKNRTLVELPGPHASVRIQSTEPAFYVKGADNWGPRVTLIPVKSTKQSRIVEKLQSGVGVGKSGEMRNSIAVERTQVAPGLYRIRPLQPLDLGEYALGELIDQKLNLDVWDFGVDGAPHGQLTVPAIAGEEPLSEESPVTKPTQRTQQRPRVNTGQPSPYPGQGSPGSPTQ
jgi:hypothetical protein